MTACLPDMRHDVSDSGRRLHVACVTETFPPEVNGVAMTLGRLLPGLAARGHQVEIVRPRQRRGDDPSGGHGLTENLVRGLPLPGYRGLRTGIARAGALAERWRQARPDVVHIVTEGPLGWSALRAARALAIPVTSGFHTNFHRYCDCYGVGWLKPLIARLLRRFHNRTGCTLVPTAALRDELARQGFRNLRVVARGIDANLFSPTRRSDALRASWGAAPADPVALYVGRLAPEKSVPLACEAFRAMRAAVPQARLVVVGDGPGRAALEQSAKPAVFAGMRVGTDLAAHYASADIFLFPSQTETYGNVTVEAMASGLAVVAFEHAAAAQHIRHGWNGIAVPVGDATGFVNHAAALATDRARIARIGARARASAESLDWERVVVEFENALVDAVLGAVRNERTARVPA